MAIQTGSALGRVSPTSSCPLNNHRMVKGGVPLITHDSLNSSPIGSISRVTLLSAQSSEEGIDPGGSIIAYNQMNLHLI